MDLTVRGALLLALLLLTACGESAPTSAEVRLDPDDPNYDITFDDWTPPAEGPFAEPGWRQTERPFCRAGIQGVSGMGVAFGNDTVFLFAADPGGSDAPQRPTLWFNSGDGWTALSDRPGYDGRGMHWLPGGWLALEGTSEVRRTSDGQAKPTPFRMTHITVDAASERALATDGTRLFEWENGNWFPWFGDPPPFEIYALALSGDDIFLGGDGGLAAYSAVDGWRVFDEGTGQVGVVAAHPNGAVAVGDTIGLFHAGSEGTIEIVDAPRGPGHVLHAESLPADFLISTGRSTLVVASLGLAEVTHDGTYRELGFWPPGPDNQGLVFQDVAPGPVGEAFLVVEHAALTCAEQVLWFDGADLHWF